MGKSRQITLSAVLAVTLALGTVSVQVPAAKAETAAASDAVKLRVMETTDIHTNILNYDYYKDKATDEFGLAKTASLIKKARGEVKNSLLFDNGDLIQGNPLADYAAKVDVLQDGETHPVYKALNQLGYDAATVGNHEFNYGLDFLDKSLKGSAFPYVNANVYKDDKDNDPANDQNYFKPYLILDKKVTDESGQEQTLKVGVIGFVPPQIMQWDGANLKGKVITKDIVETAKTFIPKMKAEGADVIVALAHTGFGTATPAAGGMDENAVYQLSKVADIDSILFGHTHVLFPSKQFETQPGVDVQKGTINGVAAVQAGSWGDNLGVIDLTLQKVNGKWDVIDSLSQNRPIFDKVNKKSLVDADQSIVDSVKDAHEGTLAYIRAKVATTTAPIHSYFALVQDDPSIQIVTNAQKWYAQKKLQGTEFEKLPILSAGAPFKAGGRSGATYYTDIPAGDIAIKNVADLYIYPNTVYAVQVTGKQVREWLEMSAGQFNQIDRTKTQEQPLVNNAFPTFNFDVIDGVTYQIDVTQPAKYDGGGKVVNANANRVKHLRFEGKPIDPDQKFLVVTNNYRAGGGGNFPGLDGKNIVLASPDENRQAIIDYMMEQKTINPSADNNWSIAPINGRVNVTFESAPKAKDLLGEYKAISYAGEAKDGFAKFKLNLKGDSPFADLAVEYWAYPVIKDLFDKKIVNGVTADEFAPEQAITRAEFAKLLVRALGLETTGTTKFSDVNAGEWYAGYVAAAEQAGIVKGITASTFAPNQQISREEMAAMVLRALEKKTGKTVTASKQADFTDKTQISPWAKDSVNAAAEAGLIRGREDSSFAPLASAVRAEAAQITFNLLTK